MVMWNLVLFVTSHIFIILNFYNFLVLCNSKYKLSDKHIRLRKNMLSVSIGVNR